MTTLEMVIRVAAGLGFGAAIGFERQYRARMAGLRTNALVAVGATLFVVMSSYGFGGLSGSGAADPTRGRGANRVRHRISGRWRDYARGIDRPRGLNTAATFWCSAAVGSLAGAGLFQVAITGTAAVLLVNIVLRTVARGMDRRPHRGAEQPPCAEDEE
ncbi:MgtC/SapB family protein [Fodinicola feengrottensis]|uniref:MgtC/SapB family protein n=1 Tax=Fodinicola feengrottensis TaxID=435914 RepID=UPI0013D69C9A|nr:MgtC/SapB family protein [Fodinicola feengrottensis]